MSLHYPRLTKPEAMRLATERSSLSIDELVEVSMDLDSANSFYLPTGGTRAEILWLQNLQSLLRETASYYGYPLRLRSRDTGECDKAWAKALYEGMDLQPIEASALGVWIYITVILVPDLVRWRFPDLQNATSIERFIGSGRGMRRNTFGRLWWRAHLFRLPSNHSDPYLLLGILSEDDQIQISERPSLSGNPRLAREVAVSYLRAQQLGQRHGIDLDRRIMLRDALKRLSRLIPITMLDMLDETQSQQVIDSVFLQSIQMMTAVPDAS